MRIGTNAIGNYTPHVQKPAAAKVAESKTAEAGKQVSDTKNVINKNEKQFFAEIYPEQKKDIMSYHFYQKSGRMSGVSVGSLLDRRG